MVRFDYDLLYSSVSSGGIHSLSPASSALCLMALGYLTKRYRWERNSIVLTDGEWNQLDYDIAQALDEIMTNIVGMILPAVIINPAGINLLPCNGAVYNRVDYPLLYSRLDSVYVIDSDTFRVPDLRDRVPVGAGNNYTVDTTGGQESVTLTESELPPHTHTYNQYTFGVDIESVGVPDPTGVGQPALPQNTGSVGGGNAHENMPPFIAINWYIVAG